jgi:hypothetical protein
MGHGTMAAAAPLNAAIHGASRMTMSWVASSRRITAVNLQLVNRFRFAPDGLRDPPSLGPEAIPGFQANDRLKVKCRSEIRSRAGSEIQRSAPSLRSA